MELTDRQLIKIAESIRGRLGVLKNQRYSDVQRLTQNVSSNLQQLQTIRQGLGKCIRSNWEGATAKLMSRLQRILHDLPYSIDETQRKIEASQIKMPSLRQLYEALRQVQEEFGRLEYNAEEETLSVFTEPIELEGIFLGDFEIQLQIPQLTQMQDGKIFRVIALDAHPATSNDVVTHPHVSDEYLCAGDASAPIQTALSGGRVCDFFMLVRSVLETYNPSSPYVSLNEWEGYPCYDCGYVVVGDDIYYCEGCDNSFCNECMSYCRCCDTSLCNGCMTSCSFCEEPVCDHCLKSCSECEEPVCSSCIEDDLCPTCKEKQENQEDDYEQNESEESTEGNQQQVAQV